MTSKEQREGDSAFRSGSGGGGRAHPPTIGSHVVRSRRMSATNDGVEKAGSAAVSVKRPESALENRLAKHATVTTECKGKTSMGRGARHFGGAGWDASEGSPGIREDEVELNNIRVQTIQTREVEIDSERERKMSAGASTDDEWMGSRKGVVSQRMV